MAIAQCEQTLWNVYYISQNVGLHRLFITISGRADSSRFGPSSKTVPWIEWLEPYDLVVSVGKLC